MSRRSHLGQGSVRRLPHCVPEARGGQSWIGCSLSQTNYFAGSGEASAGVDFEVRLELFQARLRAGARGVAFIAPSQITLPFSISPEIPGRICDESAIGRRAKRTEPSNHDT
eukprot:7951103-Pyramimonas_sp.AAC.1